MAKILESTETTVVGEKKGLHTLLCSDEEIDVGQKEKASGINIDTCFVPGNRIYLYEIMVTDNNGNKLHQERCSEKEMLNYHLGQVARYKTKFLQK